MYCTTTWSSGYSIPVPPSGQAYLEPCTQFPLLHSLSSTHLVINHMCSHVHATPFKSQYVSKSWNHPYQHASMIRLSLYVNWPSWSVSNLCSIFIVLWPVLSCPKAAVKRPCLPWKGSRSKNVQMSSTHLWIALPPLLLNHLKHWGHCTAYSSHN